MLYHAFFVEYLWIPKILLVSLRPTELNCIELKPTEKKFTFPFNPAFSFHIFHLNSFDPESFVFEVVYFCSINK